MRVQRSVTICPRPGCGGTSQIENTEKQHTRYVKRLRACTKCGATWATAEVPITDIKKIKTVDKLLKDLRV